MLFALINIVVVVIFFASIRGQNCRQLSVSADRQILRRSPCHRVRTLDLTQMLLTEEKPTYLAYNALTLSCILVAVVGDIVTDITVIPDKQEENEILFKIFRQSDQSCSTPRYTTSSSP